MNLILFDIFNDITAPVAAVERYETRGDIDLCRSTAFEVRTPNGNRPMKVHVCRLLLLSIFLSVVRLTVILACLI